jgi:hypothetical protein
MTIGTLNIKNVYTRHSQAHTYKHVRARTHGARARANTHTHTHTNAYLYTHFPVWSSGTCFESPFPARACGRGKGHAAHTAFAARVHAARFIATDCACLYSRSCAPPASALIAFRLCLYALNVHLYACTCAFWRLRDNGVCYSFPKYHACQLMFTCK